MSKSKSQKSPKNKKGIKLNKGSVDSSNIKATDSKEVVSTVVESKGDPQENTNSNHPE